MTLPARDLDVKRGIADQLLHWLGDPTGAVRGAEIGVKQGRLSEQLLSGCFGLQLYLVDWWRPSPSDGDYARSGDPAANASAGEIDRWLGETLQRLDPYRGRCHFLPCDSVLAARFVPDDSLDFVFLDADHSYQHRLQDLRAWAPKVKAGGLVAGGLIHSAFGGDCCRRAILKWHEEAGRFPDILLGPSKTWSFRK